MNKRLFLVFFFLCFHIFAYAEKKQYDLTNDLIDVVIVTHPKDQETLDDCIDGIKENCNRVRRVIVVSPVKLTDKAEWFDEKNFPFTKDEIIYAIGKGDKKTIKEFKERCAVGWYLQQLLKFYSPFVIPGISPNVLVLDADTIFMNPVEFQNESNGALFCFKKHTKRFQYFEHAKRFLPGYRRIDREIYCVCHHMLFQRAILEDLFRTIEEYHQTEFWRAFCSCVDFYKHEKAASEYEIYSNFALRHTHQVAIRPLKWKPSGQLEKKEQFKNEGYHFVTFHSYWREGPTKRK